MNKSLTCGCCGDWFQTWKGYVDQDQDEGFGICMGCQEWIEEKEVEEVKKAVQVLANGLAAKNRARFLKMDFDRQRAIVLSAINDGILKFGISRSVEV